MYFPLLFVIFIVIAEQIPAIFTGDLFHLSIFLLVLSIFLLKVLAFSPPSFKFYCDMYSIHTSYPSYSVKCSVFYYEIYLLLLFMYFWFYTIHTLWLIFDGASYLWNKYPAFILSYIVQC